ncbi:MAG: hypothetical protein LBK77_09820 [Spirochaetaceae bacterium]|jgi:hypothetical protein|nr:hypothetical protein [Spirochaetaceae bacterium]
MKTPRGKLTIGLSLATAFAVLISGCSVFGRENQSPFGTLFPIPPGVLTIHGEEPSGSLRAPPVADIYWSQTLSERGYVQNRQYRLDPPAEFYQFYTAVTKSPGINYVPRYRILKPDTGGFLRWTEVERLNPDQASFWVQENANGGTFEHGEGPLTMIYKNDLIDSQHLTIVISDLEEQGLNMTLLADLIRERQLRTADYAAAVIALKLPFNGVNYKPSIERFNDMPGTRYSGLKPLYVIVSGPRDTVSLFIRRFSDQADKFENKWYVVTTTQRGKIAPLALPDARIPQSAVRSDFARIERNNKRIMRDLWNVRSGRGDHEGLPGRIWNLQNRSSSMVDHFGLARDDAESAANLSHIDEMLEVFILQYKTTTAGSGNGHGLWQLNIDFDMPPGCDPSELEARLGNYRYLTMPDPPPGEEAPRTRRRERQAEEPKALPVWRQNEAFLTRDLDVGQPELIPGSNTAQVYVVPKDMKRGALESPVVCFDVTVRLKQRIEIPEWVNDFDDTTGRSQDKTWNFGNFVNNLLKGDSASGLAYSEDELIKIPVVLFDIPSVAKNTGRRR